jgi:hypothetical protein
LHSGSRDLPSSALKAGSTRPPLAVRTAFTTAASMLGKASFRVFSACCCGLRGRGGFGGGTSSSSTVGFGGAVVACTSPSPLTIPDS